MRDAENKAGKPNKTTKTPPKHTQRNQQKQFWLCADTTKTQNSNNQGHSCWRVCVRVVCGEAVTLACPMLQTTSASHHNIINVKPSCVCVCNGKLQEPTPGTSRRHTRLNKQQQGSNNNTNGPAIEEAVVDLGQGSGEEEEEKT